jgi:hypothetical protein
MDDAQSPPRLFESATPTDASPRRCKRVSLRQRFESYRGMLQPRAHRHHLASPKQKKVDRILDLENVKID